MRSRPASPGCSACGLAGERLQAQPRRAGRLARSRRRQPCRAGRRIGRAHLPLGPYHGAGRLLRHRPPACAGNLPGLQTRRLAHRTEKWKPVSDKSDAQTKAHASDRKVETGFRTNPMRKKSSRIGPKSGHRFSDKSDAQTKARASDRKVETGFRTNPMRKKTRAAPPIPI